MSEIKSGVATALTIAMEQHEEPEPPVQANLLGLPAPKTEAGRELVATRRAGRPPGARNKRTLRNVEWLLSRHRDPREVLLEIAEAPIDELVATLGCKPIEALQEKRLAALGVLSYVAQRMPLAVDVTDRKIIHLNIVDGLVEQGESSDGVGLTARIVEGTVVKIDDAEGGP